MTNWITSEVTVRGYRKDILCLIERVRGPERPFDFSRVLPMVNGGVKLHGYYCDSDWRLKRGSASLRITTPETHPAPVFERLKRMFPDLAISVVARTELFPPSNGKWR